ncbi:methylenetetrahydrofolate reductase [NAD(P)H] [uncultured Clostridium sp.]|jgi:methylenetetrahydrofolate reductase (NADPH)|uniref:methylenetetrahydrofolate reductase [NAD(P)H] n=1 Tax=uncultured Clostridium sp. TaxID=59620 RepID=UPI002624ABE2|nr:methylenetetrahydrofolate reductase [NAD(P)H] [uncultured Clostridium sp.]
MRIKELFDSKELVFSFEVFPPKASSSIDVIYKTLDELKGLSPDFISVTYGAGGNSKDNRTAEIAGLIKNKYGIESLAHLTCINSSEDEVREILENLKKNNVNNILALRGDIPEGETLRGNYRYSDDLIKTVKDFGSFNIAGACYPEGHNKDESLDKHIDMLKRKVDAGAEHLISQLFFDNDDFYRFLDKSKNLGLDVPIQAGIMPVLNGKQIDRIISMCGVKFPNKFMKIVDRYGHDKIALRDAGIAYAVEQIIDLASSGADGIHLYTMNNAYVASKINDSVTSIVTSLNRKIV